MQTNYFAASNSAFGFKNYYEDCFSQLDRLYIIKGGPGTGKSGFMRAAQKNAAEKGYKTESFLCSSDPSSLDGVIIYKNNECIGLVDGTAPHVYEPKNVGVVENIINLGECWDEEKLHKKKNEIDKINRSKSACYEYAYDYLRSCGNLSAVTDSMCGECIDFDKMSSSVYRMLKSNNKKEKGIEKIRLIDSVSMQGRVRLDTFERMAEKLYIIGDTYGTGSFMLSLIRDGLKSKNSDYMVSYDPVCPVKVNALFDCDTKSAFVLADERIGRREENDTDKEIKYINIKRFINPEKMSENRAEIKYACSVYKASLHGAVVLLFRAKKYHFMLEEIFKDAMNFSAVDKMIEDFCEKI